jgi:uncharacterized integral membrane protein (TIGR00698 family)
MSVDQVVLKITRLRAHLPGLLFCALLATTAMFLSEKHGGPAILYALLLGFPFHFLSTDQRFTPGIASASRDVLRIGVALLGARITVEQVAAVGAPMMLAIAVAVFMTVGFGWLYARTVGLPKRFGVLSAGATAICGASAAIAISSVTPRYPNLERDTAFTIVGVTTLSTVAMVLYPIIGRWLGFSHVELGAFLGGTIHDVAQVVGAGYSVSAETGDKATIVKLFRVALLVPVVFIIALIARRVASPEEGGRSPTLIPTFLIVFIVLVLVNSIGLVPKGVASFLGEVSRWCIVVSIAALGVKTALKSFLDVGRPAIGMMLAHTVFLACIVLAMMYVLR